MTISKLPNARAVVAGCRAGQRPQQMPELVVKVRAGDIRRKTEEVLPPPDENDDANARGETDDHRIRNKPDDAPESRQASSSSSITPAISVAICNPSMPYFAVTPERITMNAPVGPALHTAVTEDGDQSNPAMMAV